MAFKTNDLDPSPFQESTLITEHSIFAAGGGSPIEVVRDKDFQVESGSKSHSCVWPKSYSVSLVLAASTGILRSSTVFRIAETEIPK